MITKDKVTEIFCIADDFCREFDVEMAKNALPSTPDTPKRHRKRMMPDAEVIKILICFPSTRSATSSTTTLDVCVCQYWKDLFPKTFSYNRVIEVMSRCFVALTMSLKLACFGECTGISFIDSTCIPVINNKRQFSMKVFKGLAALGAYCFFAVKPEVNFDFDVEPSNGQLFLWQ